MSGKWAGKRERGRGANAAHKNENKPRSVGDKMCPSLSRSHFTFGLFRVGVNIDPPSSLTSLPFTTRFRCCARFLFVTEVALIFAVAVSERACKRSSSEQVRYGFQEQISNIQPFPLHNSDLSGVAALHAGEKGADRVACCCSSRTPSSPSSAWRRGSPSRASIYASKQCNFEKLLRLEITTFGW